MESSVFREILIIVLCTMSNYSVFSVKISITYKIISVKREIYRYNIVNSINLITSMGVNSVNKVI